MIWFLPCPPSKETRSGERGSTFGDTVTTKKTGTIASTYNTIDSGSMFEAPRAAPLNSLMDENFFKVDYTHNFHASCLQQWFDQKKTECPVCQNLIRSELWTTQVNKFDMNKAGYRRVISIGTNQMSQYDQNDSMRQDPAEVNSAVNSDH
jgi:hypothetical protein